ncbi:addiction module protein [Flavobacterium sp. ov086]|uniref:addiction module protein n=1 Tax=Flavobacterium sp. ov086 TaxID=1761785 RepID=UPI000B631C61|nr:addiction module protein [Flavobacterium sp. ov086]SNR69983.1 putative addiction module component, TIGR02574 family [Flavobacterium sp. ov086]
MRIKKISEDRNTEKKVLAEQLWNNVSSDVKKELDIRIQNLEEGKTELYTWDEVKAHIRSIR